MTMNAAQMEFLEDFSSLQDEFERYTYLTYLGNQLGLPNLDLQTDEHLVKGCQSETWVRLANNQESMSLEAYSDTLVVRGLLYILRESIEGMRPQDFSRSDLVELYDQAGLSALLTESRRSGLASILEVIEGQVEACKGR